MIKRPILGSITGDIKAFSSYGFLASIGQSQTALTPTKKRHTRIHDMLDALSPDKLEPRVSKAIHCSRAAVRPSLPDIEQSAACMCHVSYKSKLLLFSFITPLVDTLKMAHVTAA